MQGARHVEPLDGDAGLLEGVALIGGDQEGDVAAAAAAGTAGAAAALAAVRVQRAVRRRRQEYLVADDLSAGIGTLVRRPWFKFCKGFDFRSSRCVSSWGVAASTPSSASFRQFRTSAVGPDGRIRPQTGCRRVPAYDAST